MLKVELSDAWRDIRSALANHHLTTTLGWQDVATRYRRSRVGAFWLTINMAVLIAALGFVFGRLFSQPMNEFLPYLAIGLIVWGFMSTVISEGCTGFVFGRGHHPSAGIQPILSAKDIPSKQFDQAEMLA